MKIQFQFHGMSEALKEETMQYAQKRFDTLDKFLIGFPEDDTRLALTVRYEDKHTFFGLKAALHVKGKILFHEEDTHDPREAVDAAEANLAIQLKKFIERMRGKKKSAIRKKRQTVLRAKKKVA